MFLDQDNRDKETVRTTVVIFKSSKLRIYLISDLTGQYKWDKSIDDFYQQKLIGLTKKYYPCIFIKIVHHNSIMMNLLENH